MSDRNLYKGTVENIIFQLLRNNHRMYGYEISKMIKEQTNDVLIVPESKLYPMLHQLESQGMLEVEVESTGSRLRKYYKLTGKGQKEAITKLDELKSFITSLSGLITPQIS